MKKDKGKIEFSIIGAGRFGLFWGNHLRAYYPTRFFDNDPAAIQRIRRTGQRPDLRRCLQTDYIFLTLPISRISSFLKKNAALIKKGSVVIDCASVKKPVLDWFEKFIPADVYYAASHPLFGPDSARAGLTGHLIALIPGRIPLNRYNFLVGFFTEKLKLSVLTMPAEEHDRLMAYNLSLVHHLGRTLQGIGIAKLPLQMSGMKKLVEVSQTVMNDSELLFRDFYRYNPFSQRIRDKFLKNFKNIVAG